MKGMDLVRKDQHGVAGGHLIIGAVHLHRHLPCPHQNQFKAAVKVRRIGEVFALFLFKIIGGADMLALVKHRILQKVGFCLYIKHLLARNVKIFPSK